MATNRSGIENVLLGIEVGRDERKDIRWDAVDGSEGVPPLANGCQRSRSIFVELGNDLQSETARIISTSFVKELRMTFRNAQRRIRHTLELFVESEDELQK